MDPSKNFALYREALTSISGPCIPFLGVYLTDLTFIEDGNPDFMKRGIDNHGEQNRLINYAKRMKTADVLLEIQKFQSIPYALTSVPELQEYLKFSLDDAPMHTDLYEVSLVLEPKEREDEKIARLLHESGFL